MTIEFQEKIVRFDPTRGREQREPFSIDFSRNILSAQACIKGFTIGYTDTDREIYLMKIDVHDVTFFRNTVSGYINFLIRDGSGNTDDRYEGWVRVQAIAEVQ